MQDYSRLNGRTNRRIVTAAMAIVVAGGARPIPAAAGADEFPYLGAPWAQRAERLEAEARRTNVYEGHMLTNILLPPEGHPDRITGNHEDGMNNTGPFLAALCYKYAVTRNPQDRDRAKETALAIEKMEQVTGVPGCFSRSYYRTEKPVDFENRYFFPAEWHWSSTMPKTRWLGDPSSDSLTHMLEGCALYFDLVADAGEKARVAALVDRVMTRFVTHRMRLTDEDGKMTMWGDYCPDSEIECLNALLALSHLKIAHHVTGKGIYDRAYRWLIDDYKYHERAVMARILVGPAVEAAPWDNTLGLTGLYFLMKYEKDRRLLGFYRASLERYRQMVTARSIHRYDMIVQVLSSDVRQVTDKTYEYVAGWNEARREKRADGMWQRSGHGYLYQYWMGRYYGLIGPNAADAGTAAAGATPRTDLMVPPPWVEPQAKCPEGMTLVPGGEFIMGYNKGDDDEAPAHRAHVDPFFMDLTEVTNGQWKKVFPDHAFDPADADKPVIGMSWEQADAYAKAVGKRLPTEAEWEKAARGTDGRLYPWGNFWDDTLVAPGTVAPVGSRPSGRSPYGCLDMAGNVWEWTSSWYEPYPGNGVSSEAYGKTYKVVRGGSNFSTYSFKRATHRFFVAPNTREYGHRIGLRCAMDLPAPEK